MSSVPSVEPSLTITHFTGSTVCRTTHLMVFSRSAASFRAGVMRTYLSTGERCSLCGEELSCCDWIVISLDRVTQLGWFASFVEGHLETNHRYLLFPQEGKKTVDRFKITQILRMANRHDALERVGILSVLQNDPIHHGSQFVQSHSTKIQFDGIARPKEIRHTVQLLAEITTGRPKAVAHFHSL